MEHSTPEKHNARRQPGEVNKANYTTPAFSFPDPSTVKGQVLADLLLGRRITHKDTWIEHGSSRLAHHIYILRGDGWPIGCDTIEVGTSDGRRATIGEYSLPAETIREAGERGRRFVEQARRGQ